MSEDVTRGLYVVSDEAFVGPHTECTLPRSVATLHMTCHMHSCTTSHRVHTAQEAYPAGPLQKDTHPPHPAFLS